MPFEGRGKRTAESDGHVKRRPCIRPLDGELNTHAASRLTQEFRKLFGVFHFDLVNAQNHVAGLEFRNGRRCPGHHRSEQDSHVSFKQIGELFFGPALGEEGGPLGEFNRLTAHTQ